MWLSFKSLKSFNIGEVCWFVDHTPLDEEDNSELRIHSRTMLDRVVGDNDKPSCDLFLTLNADDHDTNDYLTLLESLALNTGLYDLTIITDGDAKNGKLVKFGIYLDYLTKHCPTLLYLHLGNVVINTLPDYDSKNERRKLEKLELYGCKINSSGFEQISKRFSLIKHLEIESVEYFGVKSTNGGFSWGDIDGETSGDDDNDDEMDEEQFDEKYKRQVNMPHTAFEKISLANELPKYVIQIHAAPSAVSYIKIDDKLGVQRLSTVDYGELIKLDPAMPIVTITCSEVSTISTGYGSVKLKI